MSLRRSLSTLLVPLALAAACSSEVTPNDGSGGSGGTTSATTDNVTVTSTTTTTSTTATTTDATTTTTGMGNECEQGCQHVIDCIGFDACSQFNIDCTNPQAECPGTCLNDATCEQIASLATQTPDPTLSGCIQGCQQGQGGGGVGGNGAGGGAQACSDCAQGSCGTPIQACVGSTPCLNWLMCAMNCTDPQCYTDCDTANPNAAPQSTAVKDCACTQCNTECGDQIGTCPAP